MATSAGSIDSGIGTHFSSPQAAIDIENELGSISRCTFSNCIFINGGILHALSGGNALLNTALNIYLRDLKIMGTTSTFDDAKKCFEHGGL